MSAATRTRSKNRIIGLTQGLLLGSLLAAFVHMALLTLTTATPSNAGGALTVHGVVVWVQDNLRGSLVPFTLVLLLFLHAVERLRRRLLTNSSLESLSQAEHWAELWTSLFFGIGVIWTAIGMRSALLAALGDLDTAVAAEVGAFAILRRLVDGGILIALSTTIVGGIGGYLMRVYKGLRTGALLRARYAQLARESEAAVLDRLDRLEVHLAHLARAAASDVNAINARATSSVRN